MKKWLIIILALAASTWFLVLPGAVGLIVSDRIEAWLNESAATAESRFESGWFSSRLALEDRVLAADLEARHVPPTRLGWLQVSGTMELPQLPQGSRLDGFIHIDGRTRVALESPRFDASGPTRTTLEAPRLSFEQTPTGQTDVDLEATGLGLSNTSGLALDYAGLKIELQRSPVDDTASRLALGLRLGAASDPQSLSMALVAAPVDDTFFDQLVDGIGQLSRARPDSYDAQLAMLTLAGAWAGLAEAGLVIDLEHFALGDGSEMEGRWETAAGQPRIIGSGRAEALLEFLNRIVALSRGQSPALAEPEARAWIRTLVERSLLTIDGERFRVAYPSGVEGGSTSADSG